MSQEINAIFDTGYFKKIVMGAVTVTMRNCGFSSFSKASALYECMNVLESHTAEEFEKAYQDYLINGK